MLTPCVGPRGCPDDTVYSCFPRPPEVRTPPPGRACSVNSGLSGGRGGGNQHVNAHLETHFPKEDISVSRVHVTDRSFVTCVRSITKFLLKNSTVLLLK